MTVIDLKVDYKGDLKRNPDGTFLSITGRERFEQDVMLTLGTYYRSGLGETDPGTITETLRVLARRVATEDPNIDSMPVFEVEFSDEQYSRAQVTIVYDTGQISEFTI